MGRNSFLKQKEKLEQRHRDWQGRLWEHKMGGDSVLPCPCPAHGSRQGQPSLGVAEPHRAPAAEQLRSLPP